MNVDYIQAPLGWWLAYSGSEKFEYGPKRISACFAVEQHARDYVQRMWPGGGYVEQVVSKEKP